MKISFFTLFFITTSILLLCSAIASAEDSSSDDAGDSKGEDPSPEPGGEMPLKLEDSETILSESEIKALKELTRRLHRYDLENEASERNFKKNRVPLERLETRFKLDNDLFILNVSGGDRGFSNGLRFEALWSVSMEPDSTFGKWRNIAMNPVKGWFLQLYDTEMDESRPRVGFAVGQELFTPEDLRETEPIKGDRPYVGWLYVGGIFELRGTQSRLHSEIDIGGTGELSLAEQGQTYVHDQTGSTHPEGWKHQISTGVGVNWYLTMAHLLFNIESPKKFGVPMQLVDSEIYARTSVGTWLVEQSMGGIFRFGYIKKQWRKNPAPGQYIYDRKLPEHYGSFNTDFFQIYAYSRLQSAFILRNASIQGLPFRDEANTESIQPLVHEGEVGLVLQPLNFIDIQIGATHRTQETREGRTDYGGHTWGNIQIGCHWY